MHQIQRALISSYVLLDGIGFSLPSITFKTTIKKSKEDSDEEEHEEFNNRPVDIENHSIN